MSNATLREALLLISGTDPVDAALDPQRAVRVARAALAADDAARGAMQEQFEAWHRAEFPNDPMYRSEEYGYHRESVAERWRGWQASRAAAPQSVEPPAPTDAEWQEEAMRLAREWADNSFKKGAGYSYSLDSGAALRAHIATRPLPAPPIKEEQP